MITVLLWGARFRPIARISPTATFRLPEIAERMARVWHNPHEYAASFRASRLSAGP